MTDNRNTILAVILSGLVLIGWQYFFNIPQMEKQRAQQAQSELAKPAPQPGTPGAPSATPQAGAPATPARAPISPPSAPLVVTRDVALAATPRIKIETPKLSGSISLKGARIDDLALMQFRDTVDPKSPAIVLFVAFGHARSPITRNSAGSPPPARRCGFPTRTRCGSRKARATWRRTAR